MCQLALLSVRTGLSFQELNCLHRSSWGKVFLVPCKWCGCFRLWLLGVVSMPPKQTYEGAPWMCVPLERGANEHIGRCKPPPDQLCHPGSWDVWRCDNVSLVGAGPNAASTSSKEEPPPPHTAH